MRGTDRRSGAKTSGRNTHGQVAASLNTCGVYPLTCNPLYLANCMLYVSVALYSQDFLLALALALFLVLYDERIILATEPFLLDRFGSDYRTWVAKLPVFVPRLRGWRRPALPFSVRSVLRREYPIWLLTILASVVVDFAADYFESGYAYDWNLIIALCLAGYMILHLLNRHTRLLRAPAAEAAWRAMTPAV